MNAFIVKLRKHLVNLLRERQQTYTGSYCDIWLP